MIRMEIGSSEMGLHRKSTHFIYIQETHKIFRILKQEDITCMSNHLIFNSYFEENNLSTNHVVNEINLCQLKQIQVKYRLKYGLVKM